MVAVALLPPLVTFGLLLGGGHSALAMGALSLFLSEPDLREPGRGDDVSGAGHSPGELVGEDRAVKATRIAIGLWVALLAALVGMILLLRKG